MDSLPSVCKLSLIQWSFCSQPKPSFRKTAKAKHSISLSEMSWQHFHHKQEHHFKTQPLFLFPCFPPLLWTFCKTNQKGLFLPLTFHVDLLWTDSWSLEEAPTNLCHLTIVDESLFQGLKCLVNSPSPSLQSRMLLFLCTGDGKSLSSAMVAKKKGMCPCLCLCVHVYLTGLGKVKKYKTGINIIYSRFFKTNVLRFILAANNQSCPIHRSYTDTVLALSCTNTPSLTK